MSRRGALHWAWLLFAGFVITLLGGILIGYTPHNIPLGIGIYVAAGTLSLLPSAPLPAQITFGSVVGTVILTLLFLAVVFVWHL